MTVNPVLTTGLLSPESLAKAKDSPEKIHDAAAQFEALLIGQILKSVHEGESEGWLGSGEDESSSSALSLADEYFAQALAKRGGFGLAKMISAGLERRVQEKSGQ
jgi:Rod binding domain-containing protein